MLNSAKTNDAQPALRSRLGLWDTVSIIVGIVVGTSIFRSTPTVFQNAGGPAAAMLLWLVGGLLAWCGAVCYAELATTYPSDGGDYEYLRRAFGSWCGFLFAWAQLTTIVSGNIAIMAYAFADYAARLRPEWSASTLWMTIGPVVALSALNAIGIIAGKWTQNLLTLAKVVGLFGLIMAAVAVPSAQAPQRPRAEVAVATANAADGTETVPIPANIGLALVFVLYAYGGWAHAAYVAAEVADERRNMPRALTYGIVGIAILYLAVNAAYLHALGFDGARQAHAPAADVLEQAVGPWGGRAISLLVMISALGAINGMILTATRIYAVWGADYPMLGWLAEWNRRTAAPLVAIAVQAVIAVLLILLVGTEAGRDFFDAALGRVGLNALPWQSYFGGFETLVAGSAPAYWTLCLLTGFAVFVLRARDPSRERPFRMPIYPIPALVFCATSVYMLCASLEYARWLSLIGFVPLVAGAFLGVVVQSRSALRQ